jgi:hypothetical protein
MKLRLLPVVAADARQFVSGANLAFGDWGDERFFDWAFRRVVAGRAADILLLEDGDRTIAGSAIVYRRMHCPNGEQLAAVICSSWTLPAARGRGAFTRMLAATCDIAGANNAIVLGFGRMDNASRRRFEALGAGMHPTFYCRSIPTVSSADPENLTEIEIMDAEPKLFPSAGSGFLYESAEWRAQFIERPGSIECLGVRDKWAAIVEQAPGFDRVHAISDVRALPRLATRAHARGARLFFYRTQPPVTELAGFAFEWTAGFLPTLPASRITDWSFQNGDRM